MEKYSSNEEHLLLRQSKYKASKVVASLALRKNKEANLAEVHLLKGESWR